MSRRPSISVSNYPEHLNPFSENESTYQPIKESNDNKENKDKHNKESKHKFWTFGRGHKKRTGSFSIKSTWNELFGKPKTTNAFADRRVTPGGQKSELNGRPYSSSRFTHKDQLEFDEAIGTLARRRKYTYDNTARCSSNSTTNGSAIASTNSSPEKSSADPTAAVTPKPPARSRFGQVSPRHTDRIPSLHYNDQDEEGSTKQDLTPLPPKRNGLRASQRLAPQPPIERREISLNVSNESTTRDENENVPEDYFMFKRCHQDPVRMSNLSISSCISVTSTTSAYSRKKRRAPPPPRPREPLETPKENQVHQINETSKIEVKIIEPSRSSEEKDEVSITSNSEVETKLSTTEETVVVTDEVNQQENSEQQRIIEKPTDRISDEKLETNVEIDVDSDVKGPSKLSRSDSFSVKDEIEKIEQQIKELEAKSIYDDKQDQVVTRKSIEETRQSFFKNLASAEEGVDVQLKELPRVQNECEIINLNESQVESEPKESVKVIELHISEPIKHKPEIVASPVLMRTKRSSSFTLQKQHSVEIETKGSKLSL